MINTRERLAELIRRNGCRTSEGIADAILAEFPELQGWQPIETAPCCVASTPTDNGRRPVMVTRHPFTGHHPPMAIARLTVNGWISGRRNNRLWYEPTHWRRLPAAPDAP